jgi:hypothetical protein
VSDRGFDPDPTIPEAPGRPLPSAAPTAGDDVRVCPFLRGMDAVGVARAPIHASDPSNRCASTGVAETIAVGDQDAVCLTARHAGCPRLLRAGLAAGATSSATVPSPAAPPSRSMRASAPILASVAVLVVAAAIALASVVSRGDLGIGGPVGSVAPSGSSPAVGAVAGTPSLAATPARTRSPATTPAPTATPKLMPQAVATPAPTPTPPPTATPMPTPVPTSTPRRYTGLTACPHVADCYVYVVKRNDTLTRIAIRYGLGIDEILERNPSITDPGFLYLGEEIRLPTPRR